MPPTPLRSNAHIIIAGILLAAVTLDAATLAARAQANDRWQPRFDSLDAPNGPVTTLALEGDDLYVGGRFTQVGTLAARNIARYNIPTRTWFAMGSGVDSTVYAITILPNGTLYAGGEFIHAGGLLSGHIAKWDGVAWSGLSSDPGEIVFGNVYALAVSQSGMLYAGGSFARAGEAEANNVAIWNGTRWDALGSGVGGPVNTIRIRPDGTVIVCGSFSSIGNVMTNVNGLAMWDSARGTWSLPALPIEVFMVRDFRLGGNDSIFAAVYPRDIGGPGMMIFDGTAWRICGRSNSLLKVIEPLGPFVYCAGRFDTVWTNGGDRFIPAKNIAMWNGSMWESLGSGTNGDVHCMLAYHDDLIVGGDFSRAGEHRSFNLAWWGATPSSGVGDRDRPARASLRCLPNPASTAITIESASSASPSRLEIRNALGAIVHAEPIPPHTGGPIEMRIGTDRFPPGLYFCCMIFDTSIETSSFVVVR
jgi:hypothetical protein